MNFICDPPIVPLSSVCINQISAGEIIERPVSVVKELLENSLDAGATEILICTQGGGQNYISVRDNGHGMSPENLFLSIERHTTSKLPQENLSHIATLGFRGEALASLNAVARLSISSCIQHPSQGWCLKNHPIQKIPCSMTPGTQVIVEDLFYTTPARLKFLSKAKTDDQKILILIQALSLSHPHVGFTLIQDKKEILKVLSQKNIDFKKSFQKRVEFFFGHDDFFKNFISLEHIHEYGTLYGFMSHPTHHRRDAQKQFVFINGRWIHDSMIHAAIRQVYRDILPPSRYAVGVLYFTIPFEDVDVNVHPSKREVRLKHAFFLKKIIKETLLKQLTTHSNIICSQEKSLIDPNLFPKQIPWIQETLKTFDEPSSISEIHTQQQKQLPLLLPFLWINSKSLHKIHVEKKQNDSIYPYPHEKDPIKKYDINCQFTYLPFQKNKKLNHHFLKNLHTIHKTVSNVSPFIPTMSEFQNFSHWNLQDSWSNHDFIKQDHQSKLMPPFLINRMHTFVKNNLLNHDETNPLSSVISHNFQKHLCLNPLMPRCTSSMTQVSEKGMFGSAIAQLHLLYILSQTHDGFFMIDQHAAHERMIYEQMKQEFLTQGKYIPSQELLWPVALKGINAEDQAWIWEQKHQFAPLGFMFIQENDEIFLVRMPIFAEKQSLQTLFYNLIKALHDEEESLLQDLSPMNILERIFAHMACRCSLWKGDILTVWEMNHLLRKLEQTPHFSQCNHGRPTYHFWSLKDLNRWFERT